MKMGIEFNAAHKISGKIETQMKAFFWFFEQERPKKICSHRSNEIRSRGTKLYKWCAGLPLSDCYGWDLWNYQWYRNTRGQDSKVTARKVSTNFKQKMKIVFDDYLGKWNYRAIPEVKAW